MLKLEKIIQLLLLAMLTQTGLLLMIHPMPHRLVFSQANLLFMVGLLVAFLLCLLFCQRAAGNQRFSASVKQLSTPAFLVFFDDFGQCCGRSSAVWQGSRARSGGGADADGEFSVIFSFASGD